MASTSMHWFLLVHTLLLLVLKVNAKVPAVIVFGDSSVDAGNNNNISTAIKSNFKPYGRDFNGGLPTGRFSNGRLPTDFVSQAFGIKPTIPAYLDPTYGIEDFATGVCFASAGTGYDNATAAVLNVIPLWKELEYYKEYQHRLRAYLGNDKANDLINEALHLLSLGTNDFLENYYLVSGRSSKYSIVEYQSFLLDIAQDFITELFHLGARKICIAGLPPMGCLPLERTTNMLRGSVCIEKYNDVAKDFNKKLQGALMKLSTELAGIKLVISNYYDILLEMIQNPKSFGFESASKACCGTGLFEMSYLCNRINPLTCSDANKYVFWDSFHPTEKTNRIIADYVFNNSLSQFL